MMSGSQYTLTGATLTKEMVGFGHKKEPRVISKQTMERFAQTFGGFSKGIRDRSRPIEADDWSIVNMF